jgi:APA family basic amino acid/polyamine antiporter
MLSVILWCLLLLLLLVALGLTKVKAANWGAGQTCTLTADNKPTGLCFAPYGFGGMFAGASKVFFAYLGFEMMATAPEEARNPHRDVPLGIGISVVGCTILYILMSMVITGEL